MSYNVTGNSKRDSQKIVGVGQSAAEPLNCGRFTDYVRSNMVCSYRTGHDMRESKIDIVDFKTRCDEFLNRVRIERITPERITSALSVEFGISTDWVGKRFRSYYGMSISEKLDKLLLPTRERFIQEILKAKDVNELWANLNISSHKRRGLFDKHLGVSTFVRAKAKCLMETFKVSYNPTIQDNLSLVCSQVLGDGSYDKVRGSLRISHGERQIGYALYKAALFNKAFPTTKPAGSTSIYTHTQGHKYSSWYSGRLPSKICAFVENSPPKALVRELTPRGIMLWFMDDGSMDFDFTKGTNHYVSMYVHDYGVTNELVGVMKSYGIEVTVSKSLNSPGMVIKIGNLIHATMFYKCFIEPFLDELPDCMKYKTTLKI